MPNISHLDDSAIKRKGLALCEAGLRIIERVEANGRDDLRPDEELQVLGIFRELESLNLQLGGGLTAKQHELARSASKKGLSLMPSTGSLTRPNPQDGGRIGMSGAEIGSYSIIKAIRAMASGDWRSAPQELEASDAVAQQLGKAARGVFIPRDALEARMETRDLLKGTTTAGGFTVGTDLLGASFIDLLRNASVVRVAGATILSGLVGDITIPRQSGPSTAYWVPESGALTESQQTFEQVALTPKTMGAYTDISRKLLLQSSVDVEQLVRSDLAATLGQELDRVALHGSGSSSQPTGVDHTTGIGSVAGGTNGAAPTYAHIVGLETAVAAANAATGKLAYITNTQARGKLKQTLITATYGDRMVWGEGATPLNGNLALASNAVSHTLTKGSSGAVCSAIFFGNWGDLLIGEWGTLDILVDPYTGGTSGTVRVIAFMDVDIGVRHPESFAAMLDALCA